MNSQNILVTSKILLLAFALQALGCGVKGDPLPPEKPAVLGRGRPTYQRASEEISVDKNQSKKSEEDRDDD